MTITICSSAAFYADVVNVQEQLQKMGYQVLIPKTAQKMKETGDFEVSHYKTWFENANDYHKKADFMMSHFKEIEKGDVCLVLNYEKHGVQNYIGGNVLMEMAIAFYLDKQIFILNDVPSESTFTEEILGMSPVVLHGNLQNIKKLITL